MGSLYERPESESFGCPLIVNKNGARFTHIHWGGQIHFKSMAFVPVEGEGNAGFMVDAVNGHLIVKVQYDRCKRGFQCFKRGFDPAGDVIDAWVYIQME